MHEKFINWTFTLNPEWVGMTVYVTIMMAIIFALCWGFALLAIATDGLSILISIIALLGFLVYAFYIAFFGQG